MRIRRSPLFVCGAIVAATLILGGCKKSSNPEEDGFDVSAEDEAEDDGPEPIADPAKGDVLMLGGAVGGSFKFGKTSGAITLEKSGTVEFFDAKKGKFATSGKLETNRLASAAGEIVGGALDGQALVTGGYSGKLDIKKSVLSLKTKPIATGETFDPDSEKSDTLADKLGTARAFHTETELPDGRIVIAGGFGDKLAPTNAIEIFNPANGTFTAAGVMSQPRVFHSATLLPNGQILFAGGAIDDVGVTTTSAETYNPATAISTPTSGRLPSSIAGHAATLVSGCGCSADGKVLLAGGFSSFSFTGESALTSSLKTVLLYDPATRQFTSSGVPQLTEERALPSATLLPDGKVLIAGGAFGQVTIADHHMGGLYGGLTGTAEIYDPAAAKMTCVGGSVDKGKACKPSLVNARFAHAAVLLSSGKVLLAGGIGGKDLKQTEKGYGAPLKTAETFDPGKGEFKSAGSMKSARIFPATAVVH